MESVVLLNTDYSFLSVITWKKAIRLMVKEKAIVLYDNTREINSENISFFIPKVLKLINMVSKIYKTKVPFSKRNVIIRDKYTCNYCGIMDGERNREGIHVKMTIDHIIPRAQGGNTSYENCTAACGPCNHRKNDRTPQEAGLRLINEPYQPTITEFFRMKMKTLGIDVMLKECGVY